MDESEIFKSRFQNEFVPILEKHLKDNKLPRKALLIQSNAPSHPSIDGLGDRDIKAEYLQPNVTAICQPMDQSIFEMIKEKYRQRLICSLISATDNNEGYKLLSLLKYILGSNDAMQRALQNGW